MLGDFWNHSVRTSLPIQKVQLMIWQYYSLMKYEVKIMLHYLIKGIIFINRQEMKKRFYLMFSILD